MGDKDGLFLNTLKTSQPSNPCSATQSANSKPVLKHDINSIIEPDKKNVGNKHATNIITEQNAKANGMVNSITLYPLSNQSITFPVAQPAILHPLQTFTSQIFDDSLIPTVNTVVPQGAILTGTTMVPVSVNLNPVHILPAPASDQNVLEVRSSQEVQVKKEAASFPPVKIVNVKGKMFECANCSFKTRHIRHYLFHPKKCWQFMEKHPDLKNILEKNTKLISQSKNLPGPTKFHNPTQPQKATRPYRVFQVNNPQMVQRSTNRVQTVPPQILFKGVAFQCDLCPSKFSNERSLKSHVRNKHKPLYSCNYCSFKASEKNKIQQHLDKDCKLRPPKCFTCMLCNEVLRTTGEVESHFTVHHPHVACGQYTVKQGYLSAGNAKSAVSHVFQNHNPDPKLGPLLSCVSCPYKTISLQELEEHISSHTSDQVLTSKSKNQCDRNNAVQAGTYSNSLQKPPHVTHNQSKGKAVNKRKVETIPGMEALGTPKPKKEKNVPCNYCEFRTNTQFNLKRHIKCRHSDVFQTLYGDGKKCCTKPEKSNQKSKQKSNQKCNQKAEDKAANVKIGGAPLVVNSSKDQSIPAMSQSYIPLQQYQSLQTFHTVNAQSMRPTVPQLLRPSATVPVGALITPRFQLVCSEQEPITSNVIQKAQIQAQTSHPLVNTPSYLYYTPPLQGFTNQQNIVAKQDSLAEAQIPAKQNINGLDSSGTGRPVQNPAQHQFCLASGDTLRSLTERNKLQRVNSWLP